MSLSEEFVNKVARISHNQEKLIQLMNDLDEDKRLTRSIQRNWSSCEKDDGGLTGSQRSNKLRKIKDKVSFLIEEREYVKQKLATLKTNKKTLNRAVNKKASFTQAFYAASEIGLPEEIFLKLESKAHQLLEESKG